MAHGALWDVTPGVQALGVVACGEAIVVFLGSLPLVESSGHLVEVVLDEGEAFLSDVEVGFFG